MYKFAMIILLPRIAIGCSWALLFLFVFDPVLAVSALDSDVAIGLLSPGKITSPLGKPFIRKERATSGGKQSKKHLQHWQRGRAEGADRLDKLIQHEVGDTPIPFVSFVIPTKGRPDLNRTLESLIAQGDPAWEAIVVCDPGPCQDLIRDRRIKQKALANKIGDGVNGAGMVRNEGIQIAKGDFIGFVDDDDTLDVAYVETLKAEALGSPEAQLIVFRMCYVNPPGNSYDYKDQCKDSGKLIYPEKNVTTADQLQRSHVGISYAIRRQLAKQPENMFHNGGEEDFDQLLMLRNEGTDIAVSQSVMYYVSGAQLTLTPDEAKLRRSYVAVSDYADAWDIFLPAIVTQNLNGEWFVLLGAFFSIIIFSMFYIQVLAKICAFFIAGSGLILLHQHILKKLHFSYPMSLAGLGMLATSLIVRFGVDVLGVASVSPKALESLTGDTWYKKVLPIAVAKSLTLAFGNAAYLRLGLGIIQMLKYANPAITVAVGAACGLIRLGRCGMFSVVLIMLGMAMVVHGALHCTAVGLAVVLASELFEAIHMVLAKKLLRANLSLVDALYILTPPVCTCLFSMAAVFEVPQMIHGGHYLSMVHFPIHFIAAAILACAVNLLSMAVVQATSTFMLKMVVSMRSVVLISFAVIFYKETVTPLEGVGFVVALVGFIGYYITAAEWHLFDPAPIQRRAEALSYWIRF